MTKKERKIILFPGTYTRLLEEAEQQATQYQFQRAVELFDEAFQYEDYDTVRDPILYTYAYCLHEVKDQARAKAVCDFVLHRRVRSPFYFEFAELYVSICIDARDYSDARELIDVVLAEGYVPPAQIEQFQQLRTLNEKLAQKQAQPVEEVETEQTVSFAMDVFTVQAPTAQLQQLYQLATLNVRPYSQQLKAIVEAPATHAYVKSVALLLLVEQQVDLYLQVEKFGQTALVNASELSLPVELPQYIALQQEIAAMLAQEPSMYELVTQLVAKHSIVAYPFEWLQFDTADVAQAYRAYVGQLMGEDVALPEDIAPFIYMLEHLCELM